MAPRKKTTLVQCLSEIEDPRVGNGKRYDLVEVNRSPFSGRHEARSVIHRRPVQSLATNRKPAGGG
jgi:hypothetical protein